jgi:hypothetical protein
VPATLRHRNQCEQTNQHYCDRILSFRLHGSNSSRPKNRKRALLRGHSSPRTTDSIAQSDTG